MQEEIEKMSDEELVKSYSKNKYSLGVERMDLGFDKPENDNTYWDRLIKEGDEYEQELLKRLSKNNIEYKKVENKENLFRAKIINTDKWVYGYFIKTPITAEFNNADGCFFDTGKGRYCIIQDCVAHEIDINTLESNNIEEFKLKLLIAIKEKFPFPLDITRQGIVDLINNIGKEN